MTRVKVHTLGAYAELYLRDLHPRNHRWAVRLELANPAALPRLRARRGMGHGLQLALPLPPRNQPGQAHPQPNPRPLRSTAT